MLFLRPACGHQACAAEVGEGNCDIATPEGARIRHVPVGFFTPDRYFGPPTVVAAVAHHRRTFPPCGRVAIRESLAKGRLKGNEKLLVEVT
jgi:hypothetical protein